MLQDCELTAGFRTRIRHTPSNQALLISSDSDPVGKNTSGTPLLVAGVTCTHIRVWFSAFQRLNKLDDATIRITIGLGVDALAVHIHNECRITVTRNRNHELTCKAIVRASLHIDQIKRQKFYGRPPLPGLGCILS